MHYRLRCPIGFLNVQKKSKSKRLFLTPKSENFALFVKIMTQILYQKNSYLFQKANMAKIMVNVQKRLNRASTEDDFWYGDNVDHVKKKAQNIVLQISVHKLLASKLVSFKRVQLVPFSLPS